MTGGQLAGDIFKSALAVPIGLTTSSTLLNPAVQAYLRNQLLANRRPQIRTNAPFSAVRGAAQEGLLGE
jgi:hypothetical protein